MSLDELAKIVAFARLLGVKETDEEIFKRYQAAYEAAIATLSLPSEKENLVEVRRSPFA